MNAQNISAEYLKELVEVAINAALKAGNYLRDNKNLDKEIYLEKGRDIKLEIDRNSEKIIYEELKGTKISFLGEEFGLKKKIRRWFALGCRSIGWNFKLFQRN